jgi:hypothetical protein
MLSNIVSTAAGVGIGHAIGHGLTGMFGGSSAPAATADQSATTTTSDSRMGSCDADAKAFTSCMDNYKGDMSACSWYLEQLKVSPLLNYVYGLVLSTDGESVLDGKWTIILAFCDIDR